MAKNNTLYIIWNDKKTDTFRQVKSESQAWDVVFKRTVENIESAVYVNSRGERKRLIPRTPVPNEDPSQIPIPGESKKIL